METKNIFINKERVSTYECDASNNIKLGFLLKKIEETSYMHYDAHGYDFKYMTKKGQIYLLNSVFIKNKRMPFVGEEYTIETWEEGTSGVIYNRNFLCKDSCGNVLSSCKTLWVLVDFNTHKIIRPKNCIYEQYFIDKKIDVEQIKITMPQDCKKIIDYTVSYKDLDRYDHMNNTVYCDIAQSVIPFDYKNEFVSEFNIYFKNETKLNDIMEIVFSENTENIVHEKNPYKSYFVGGINQKGKICFECTMALSKNTTNPLD